MTPRSSSRALAQEIYGEMAEGPVRRAATPTSNPSPQGGGEQAAVGGRKESLTEKARGLYEGSAVPVAEIAAAVGVTERTIYKYAAKENWKPRYRWSAAGGRPRGASWQAPARLVPVKGAGGRFVRRADKGKPFAVGLKATDRAAAARAASACAEAERIARAAETEARIAALDSDLARAWKATDRAIDDLAAFHNEYRAAHGGEPPADDVLGQAYVSTICGHFAWRSAIMAEIARLRAEADAASPVAR